MLVYQHDGRFPPCQRHTSSRPDTAHTRVKNLRSNLHRWRGLANGSNLMCQGAVGQTLLSGGTFGRLLSLTTLSPWPPAPIRETNIRSPSALTSRPPSYGFTFWRKDRKGLSGAHHAVALRTAGGHVVSDLAWMGGNGESAGEDAGLVAEVGERIREQEMARRRKISIANKNRVPWNKGRKWSDEMKDKIRNNTRIAMQNPEIRLRLQQNAQKQGSKTGMSPEVRAKISAGVVPHNRTRTAVSQARKQVLTMWRAAIGQAAQQGGPGEVGLEWVSCRTIKYVGDVPTVPKPPRVSPPKKPRGGPRGPRSEEHRKRIADAIREKWMDPSYRERVLGGMAVVRESGASAAPPRRKYRKRSPPSPTSTSSTSTSTRRKRASPQAAEDPIVFEGVPPTADPAFLAAVMEGDEGGEGEESPIPRKLTGGRFTKVKIVNRLGDREAGEAVGSGSTESGLDMLEEVWREHEELKKLREAAQEGLQNARMLMAEALRATEALTGDDDLDEQSAASLAEAQHYLEAAAQSIAEAESQPCEPTSPAGIFSFPLPPPVKSDGSAGPHHRALFRAALAGEGSEEEQADSMRLLAECFGAPLEFSQAERIKAFEAAHGWLVRESRGLRQRQRREGEGLGSGAEDGRVDESARAEGEGGDGGV